MIAVEKREAARYDAVDRVFAAMRERKCTSFGAHGLHNGIMSDATQRDNCDETVRGLDGRIEKRPAVFYFFRRRLVFGRYATHGVGDAAIDELQSIISGPSIGTRSETISQQGLIEKIACEIAGKGTACAVSAFKAGCKADNQQASVERAK